MNLVRFLNRGTYGCVRRSKCENQRNPTLSILHSIVTFAACVEWFGSNSKMEYFAKRPHQGRRKVVKLCIGNRERNYGRTYDDDGNVVDICFICNGKVKIWSSRMYRFEWKDVAVTVVTIQHQAPASEKVKPTVAQRIQNRRIVFALLLQVNNIRLHSKQSSMHEKNLWDVPARAPSPISSYTHYTMPARRPKNLSFSQFKI